MRHFTTFALAALFVVATAGAALAECAGHTKTSSTSSTPVTVADGAQQTTPSGQGK